MTMGRASDDVDVVGSLVVISRHVQYDQRNKRIKIQNLLTDDLILLRILPLKWVGLVFWCGVRISSMDYVSD
jgi:hypothetical protein